MPGTPDSSPSGYAPPALLPGESPAQLDLMLASKPYLGSDPYLCRVRDDFTNTLREANAARSAGERMRILRGAINFVEGDRGASSISSPFTAEYGFNISIGDDTWIGPNCQFLDVNQITIGPRTLIGANCQLYTPTHPLSPEARDGLRGPESARPITIGGDCWLGGGVIVCPGVTIGDGCTVGAGSVVTKDVARRTVVAGNPARVIKRITEDGQVENVEHRW